MIQYMYQLRLNLNNFFRDKKETKMTKKVLLVLVLLVGFVATGCATGRYLGPKPFPGPLGDVVAGNLGMTCPGDIFVGPPVNRCLRSIGGNAGRYSNSPMYRGGIGGKRLSDKEKLAVLCGLGGSGVAMLLDAGLKRIIGAGLVSAATCGVASALASNRKGGSKDVIVTPPLPNQQDVRWGSDGIPVAVGTRPNGSASGGFWSAGSTTSGGRLNCMEQGMTTLDNQSSGPLRVFKDAEPFEVIMPKGQMCAPLNGNYTGEVIGTVVGKDGLTGRVSVAPAKPESKPGLVLVWR